MLTEEIYFNLTLFVFGIAIGSFLNVCIYRIPKKMSIWQGRSRCPSCGKTIHWYHLVPVLSFVFLGGKCCFCKKCISWPYPLIELFSGIWTVFLFHMFGWTHSYLVNLTFSWIIIVISAIDLQTQRIPNSLILAGIIPGLLLYLTENPGLILQKLIDGLICGFALWIISFLNKVITGKNGFGGGDIKLIFLIGFYLGLEGTLWSFGIACIVGAIAGIFGLSFGLLERKTRIAFAPYLGFGVLSFMILNQMKITDKLIFLILFS